MAFLKVGDLTKEAKGSFGFRRYADKHFTEVTKDKEGKETTVDGLTNIYQKLLNFDLDGLIAFWQCAFNCQREDTVSVNEIELALEQAIDKDEDTQPLFKEALLVFDESGFFKRSTQKFWSNLELAETMAKTNEEKEEVKLMREMLTNNRLEVMGS